MNTSPDALTRIVLRLDQNRFRVARGEDPVTRGIEVISLAVDDEPVDLASSAITGLSTTVLTIQLGRELAPGDTTIVHVQWNYEVPEDATGLALRQGRWGSSVFQIAQWYPRLAMLDDLGGWDDAPHDGSNEFFNPFGSFRVALFVPAGWAVGATGTLQNPEGVLSPSGLERLRLASQTDTAVTIIGADDRSIADERIPWMFVADSVSDFAWGASSEYTWSIFSGQSPTGEGIQLHVLASDRHRSVILDNAPRFAEALERMSAAVMPYPWSSHTLLDGPEGGMEYPTLTMTDGSRIGHEIAHQWFPMIVGTDESRFDFLDEGLATFYASIAGGRGTPAVSASPALPLPLIGPGGVRQPPALTLGYGRGRRMLSALVLSHGETAVLDALSTYATHWRFKHPSPWDFMASLSSSLNSDLTELWSEWLYSTGAIESPGASR